MYEQILGYLNKHVIGQTRIKTELARFLNANLNGENFNYLIIGPSGYGKSHLIKVIGNILGIDQALEYNPENFIIEPRIKIHVIDEAHMVREPEILYPFLDSKKYTFIFGTNLPGLLKEPLKNRCNQFYLDKYTDTELGEIIKYEIKLDLPKNYYDLLGSVSRGNPRVAIKSIGTRFRLLVNETGIPRSENELMEKLEELYIQKGGFTQLDQIYLNFLRLAGRASLNTISATTGLDKDLIINDIEPFLINKGLVQITPRGRICF